MHEAVSRTAQTFQLSVLKEQNYFILKNKFKDDEWFDKLDGVGNCAQRLFLVFDEQQNLEKIQVNSMI